MNININNYSIENSKQNGKPQKSGQIKSLNIGNLTANNTKTAIDKKRELVKKQAMKIIGDALNQDNKALDSINDMYDKKSESLEKLNDIQSKLKDIDNKKESLRLEYGIDADSEEQKDLELLEKYQNNINGAAYDDFTEEEINRLKELQNEPRTEYQKKALMLNSSKDKMYLEIKKIENEIIGMTESISMAEIELNKSQNMLKATESANGIIEASEDEILGMLIKEGMDNIEEKMEEELEKAKEAAEKKAEEEEKIEERKEQKEFLEKQEEVEKLEHKITTNRQSDTNVAKAQNEIRRILEENNMINEDLKGIDIDLNF